MSGEVLGIGCDIVNVARIVRMAQRDPYVFLERVMGMQERAEMEARHDWMRCARHVAAKEAFFKALGTGLTGSLRWTDAQVVYVENKAQLLISGAAQLLMRETGGSRLALSMASSGDYAMATVVLMGERTATRQSQDYSH